MSVHREGENPSSMDGVPDLRDHNSIALITFFVVDKFYVLPETAWILGLIVTEFTLKCFQFVHCVFMKF